MSVPEEGDVRAEALRRVRERRDFVTHLITYMVVNIALVLVWATTGLGYFWPGWVIGGWGIGLVLHAWTAFLQHPITAADVDREMERLQRGSGGARA
jgi:hypothetical protein